MKHYPLPNFKSLQPNYLTLAVKQIYKSRLIQEDKDNIKTSINRYYIALEKFTKGEQLKKRDYVVMLYHLDDIINKGYFGKFFNILVKEVNFFKTTASFCYPLLSFIYNNFNQPRKEIILVYKFLVSLLKNNRHKKRFTEIVEQISISETYIDYLKRISNKYNAARDKNDFLILNRQFLLKRTDKFYFKCISSFIVKNHRDNSLMEFMKKTVETMDMVYKKSVLEQIILCYEQAQKENDFHHEWFAFIKEKLHDPFEKGNSRWVGISEKAIDIFRRWNILKNIHQFFIEISGGDIRRLNYWSKHINNIYRIEHFKDLNNALVMEFERHTIIEFAEKNNACFIYHKNDINLENAYKISGNRNLSRTKKIKALKNDYHIEKLFHTDNWESKFDLILWQKYSYRKGR